MKLNTVKIISTINFSVTEGLHFLWYLNKNILFVFQKLLLIIEVLHLGLNKGLLFELNKEYLL